MINRQINIYASGSYLDPEALLLLDALHDEEHRRMYIVLNVGMEGQMVPIGLMKLVVLSIVILITISR